MQVKAITQTVIEFLQSIDSASCPKIIDVLAVKFGVGAVSNMVTFWGIAKTSGGECVINLARADERETRCLNYLEQKFCFRGLTFRYKDEGKIIFCLIF